MNNGVNDVVEGEKLDWVYVTIAAILGCMMMILIGTFVVILVILLDQKAKKKDL